MEHILYDQITQYRFILVYSQQIFNYMKNWRKKGGNIQIQAIKHLKSLALYNTHVETNSYKNFSFNSRVYFANPLQKMNFHFKNHEILPFLA